jgi:protein TonB
VADSTPAKTPSPEPAKTISTKKPSAEAVARVIGKLASPTTMRKAVPSSPSEAPVIPASASAPALGNSLILSSEPAAPVSPSVARAAALSGGRVVAAKLISSTSPIYPSQASLQRVQGDVVVDALVDDRGRVTEAKALSGSPLLQQAAINAVRNWKYEPARLDGEAVSTHTQVRVSFRLP